MAASAQYWDTSEVTVWYWVTSKLVQKCDNLTECLAVIDQRWNAALPHLSPAMRPVMSDGIGSMRESVSLSFSLVAQ